MSAGNPRLRGAVQPPFLFDFIFYNSFFFFLFFYFYYSAH